MDTPTPKKSGLSSGGPLDEIVANGYTLSGAKYYDAFRDVCMEMVDKYGVNQFKFDGTGNVDSVVPGSRFDSDFDAAIHLIGELLVRSSLTSSSTSPREHGLRPSGSSMLTPSGEAVRTTTQWVSEPFRERWITYRDAQTYHGIVQNGPLFPLSLSSLMAMA